MCFASVTAPFPVVPRVGGPLRTSSVVGADRPNWPACTGHGTVRRTPAATARRLVNLSWRRVRHGRYTASRNLLMAAG
jgi:hypothetical protein